MQRTSQPAAMLTHMMTIGDRLRWVMEVCDVSQVSLAAQIGVTQSAISNVVNGQSRKPSAPTLLKLSSVLNCNPSWILDGQGEPFVSQEMELLQLLRKASPELHAALLLVAREATKSLHEYGQRSTVTVTIVTASVNSDTVSGQ